MNITPSKKQILMAAGLAVPFIASRATKGVIGKGYRAFTDREAPKNPASPSTEWKDALTWSILTGAAGGLARLVMRRALAHSSVPTDGYDMEQKKAALEQEEQ